VLHGTTLALAPGEIVGLEGPSGCGKSTLGRVLAGIARPQHGRVELDEGRTATGAHPVQLVLQHAERAMDPRWRIRDVLAETGASPDAVAATRRGATATRTRSAAASCNGSTWPAPCSPGPGT
jgi:peptide/nickel transport system ATP-binding protein